MLRIVSSIYVCSIYWRGGSVLEPTPRNRRSRRYFQGKATRSKHRYVDTSNILVVQARFYRKSNTQQQSWEPLHGLRNNGGSRRTRPSTATRIGGKIWCILCHSTLTSLHFSPMAPPGQRRLRPSPCAVSLMTGKPYRSPDAEQLDRKSICGTHARSNSQLLSCNIKEHFSKEFDLHSVCLIRYANILASRSQKPTFWILQTYIWKLTNALKTSSKD